MLMFWVMVLWGTSVHSFSIDDLFDVGNPKFYFPDDQTRVEFGSSIALFNDNHSKKLLVGAPRANTSQVGVTEAGALYACDIQTLKERNLCSQLTVDTRNAEDKYSSYINQDAKDYQRLGTSVVSHHNHVVVCAPNWHYYEIRTNAPIDTPVGTCFESWSLEDFRQFSVPYDLYGDQSIDYLRTGSCQSGFSAALTPKNEVILGSPGCYNWQGDVFAGSAETWSQFGKNFTQTDIGGMEDKKIWMSNHYSGFSVAQGTFNQQIAIVSGSPRSTHTPSEMKTPDGEPLEIVNPMVNIFLNEKKWLNLWSTLTPPMNAKEPEWLFSYFGYAVAVADVDNNGLDDVIVGAPYYHNRSLHDQGAIVVFLQKRIVEPGFKTSFQMVQEDIERLRVGNSEFGRFGSCISAIGDVDGDGIQDIAVGAPHSSDGGKVFVFLGSIKGLQTTAEYSLSASDIYFNGEKLTGFGAAIAPSLVLSESGQSDLAISAVDSDVVVILESREMITIDWNVRFEEKMDLRSKCVFNHKIQPCTSIKTCLTFEFLPSGKTGDTRPKEFELSYLLDKDYQRLFFDNGKTTRKKTVFVEYMKMICFMDNVYTNRQIDNFESFQVDARIKHIRNKRKDKSALHHSQAHMQTQYLEIVIDCTSNDVGECKSDLQLRSTVYPESAVMIDNLKFTTMFELQKKSQPSYSTALTIKTNKLLELSGKASVDPSSTFQTLVDCRKYGAGRFKCYLGNFLNEHDILKFNLTFTSSEDFLDLENIRYHHQNIVIRAQLTSLSQIVDPEAAKTENQVALKAKPDLLLTKDSSTEFITFNDSSYFVSPDKTGYEIEQIGPEISHSFKVYNPKNYAIENITLTMYWPHEILDQKPLVTENYLTSTPEGSFGPNNCMSRKSSGIQFDDMTHTPMVQNITWFVSQCQIPQLDSKQTLLIRMDARVVMKTLKEDVASIAFDQLSSYIILESNPVLLSSEIIILHRNHIFTVIHYKNISFGKLSWWLILLAVVVAMILMGIIIVILRKCNFFKRNKTAELPQETPIPNINQEEIMESEIIPLQKTEEYDNIS